jgi:GDPmannose 4,6-dehydratase
MEKALITGITGQDGAYLAKLLLGKSYRVFGTYRRLSTPNFWRLQYLDIFEQVELIPCDLIDGSSLAEALAIANPDEIYNLAAQSFVGASFEQPISAGEITGLSVTRLLELVRRDLPHVKLYQASSSELYGNNDYPQQNEATPFAPSSPYGAAKLYAHEMARIYRQAYNLFACNGILFNHESPIRGLEFVTRKITNAVAKIKLGIDSRLELGNLDAVRDWGYAPEYVEAMWRILQMEEPDDYVIATHETHSVRTFVETAFNHVALDWKDFVHTNEKYMRPLDVKYLKGDITKARKTLGWEPKTKFTDLVKIMVEADLDRWSRWMRGEHFPWDAAHYPNEGRIVSRKLRYDTL